MLQVDRSLVRNLLLQSARMGTQVLCCMRELPRHFALWPERTAIVGKKTVQCVR